jgi:hypothetical protein
MSAPIGFSSQGLRGAAPRDFASLIPLGVDNLDGVKCFCDEAWLIFRGETRGLLQPPCVCSSRPAFHAVE